MHAPGNGPVFAAYYSILAAFGIPANLVTIVILSQGRCGLSKCITLYLLLMAVADLLIIITAVILSRLRAIYFPVSFLSITPACSLIIIFSWASKDTSVWLTVAFTFDRFIAIRSQKLKRRYCTDKIAAVITGIICVLGTLKNVPSYFLLEPLYVVDNVPWYCNIKDAFYTSALWRVYEWQRRLLNPCLPFLLILLLNVLTVRHILEASRARRRLRAQSNRDNRRDPEMESRRKSIILLMTISGSFILLRFTYLVNFIFVQVTNNNYAGSYDSTDPKFILQESGYMLELLSSCTNSCIYTGTQTNFRGQLKNAVKYPFGLFRRMLKFSLIFQRQ
ncbi:probable G-protein coupled receptor 139 [Pristis pectinata]|uniref:probable G-protein coupled receptor 139 n=1 Tax=Pristis pectinata TaxID=685728 RepID=UPI00223CBB0E|nr:probable G-protein coupled receptor 139 [Pristis pectinata]